MQVEAKRLPNKILYVTFIKSLTAQADSDVNLGIYYSKSLMQVFKLQALGTPGGLFYFVDGPSHKLHVYEYVWLQEKVDLSDLVAKDEHLAVSHIDDFEPQSKLS